MPRRKRSDPSVFAEPHLRDGPHRPDPSEPRAGRTLDSTRARDASDDERVEHTVWDEPGLSPDLAGAPAEGQLTYDRWLERRRGETSEARSWAATLVLALLAGPWAILGAFVGSSEGGLGFAYAVILAPVVEEMMKTAAAMYVIEKRPFLFKHRGQIILCALAAAATFASVENVLYLHVYFDEPAAWLVRWRWSVCVPMHVGCTLIASGGLLRVWRDLWARRARPQVTLAFPYLVAAMVVHGAYNALAVAFTLARYRP